MADNNDNMSSGKNLVKVIIIIILIVVLLAASFFTLINGIINILEETAKEAIGAVAGAVTDAANKGIQWLGLAKVSKGLPIFVVNKEQIENLKVNLESQAIDTDTTGMTEIRLRKILLAYAVSSSLSDTVCAVETTEEDIINNFKKKNKEYKNDDSVTIDTVLNSYGSTSSSSVWNISDPSYTLYYTDNNSKTFFYFKDTDKVFGDNEEAWFLGAMGATSVSTAEGTNLSYVINTEFEAIKDNFEAAEFRGKLNSEAYKQMLSSYTRAGDVIKLYTVDISQKEYYFCFENNNINNIEEPKQKGNETIEYDIDADSIYNVGVQEINLADSIDLSKYSIPIELMIDLLNITGSGEFLETFIDYSLEQINTSVTAYSLMAEEVTYNQTKYNIASDFVIEMYDIIDYGITEVADFDSGEDNFKAYYDIIYNRRYEGESLPNNKVTSILDYKDINYDGIEYGEDKKYSVGALAGYLKTAYDPSSEFSLGDMQVTEVIANRTNKNKWQFMVSKIGTWYGDFTYTVTGPETVYSIPEKLENADENEYNNYNHTKMNEFETRSDQTKEVRYIYDRLIKQVAEGTIKVDICERLNSNDIYDNVMKVGNGADNRPHFDNWAMRGLVAIAQNDGGEKNANSGAGEGTDYIYCKYKKINIKKGEAYKGKIEIINENNIVQTTSNNDLETKLKNFLELLRNKTGEIPTSIGSEGGFTAKNANPSVVVKYGDIYDGTIPAGDLLLDNGAEMLFELLELSENTQELVNVFRYLAYLYTGTVHDGITDSSQIAYLFSATPYAGTDFTVHTGMSSKDIVLDEEKLRKAINKTYSGQAKNNLLNSIDAFVKIQETNNVNAVFAIAVTTIESSTGTNWAAIDSSTYNWFSIKGSYNGESYNGWKKYPSFAVAVEDFGNLISNSSYYFKAGKYTVSEIAPTYCNAEWGNSVISQMTKIYNNAGVALSTGGIEGAEGNVTTFTVNGRTYKNYSQLVESYKTIQLACYPYCNLRNSGCAITSDAIIATGFGHNVTPVDVNELGSDNHPWIVNHYTGMKCEWIYTNVKKGIIEQLNRGYPAMVFAKGGTFNPSGRGHFLVILSISDDKKKIYVSNPAGTKNGVNCGWVNASALDSFRQYMKMT